MKKMIINSLVILVVLSLTGIVSRVDGQVMASDPDFDCVLHLFQFQMNHALDEVDYLRTAVGILAYGTGDVGYGEGIFPVWVAGDGDGIPIPPHYEYNDFSDYNAFSVIKGAIARNTDHGLYSTAEDYTEDVVDFLDDWDWDRVACRISAEIEGAYEIYLEEEDPEMDEEDIYTYEEFKTACMYAIKNAVEDIFDEAEFDHAEAWLWEATGSGMDYSECVDILEDLYERLDDCYDALYDGLYNGIAGFDISTDDVLDHI